MMRGRGGGIPSLYGLIARSLTITYLLKNYQSNPQYSMNSYNYKGYTIDISRQHEPVSPRDFGGSDLFLVCTHDEVDIPPLAGNTDGIVKRYTATHFVFECRLEWSLTVPQFILRDDVTDTCESDALEHGLVFVSRDLVSDKYQARLLGRGLLKTWNDYMAGNVYTYTIRDEGGRLVAEQGGFYEDEIEPLKMLCYFQACEIVAEDLSKRAAGNGVRRLMVRSV